MDEISLISAHVHFQVRRTKRNSATCSTYTHVLSPISSHFEHSTSTSRINLRAKQELDHSLADGSDGLHVNSRVKRLLHHLHVRDLSSVTNKNVCVRHQLQKQLH